MKNNIAYVFVKKEDNLGNLIEIEKKYNKDVLTCYDRILYSEDKAIGLNENFQWCA